MSRREEPVYWDGGDTWTQSGFLAELREQAEREEEAREMSQRHYQEKRTQPTVRKEPLAPFSGELPRALLDELEAFKQLSGLPKYEIFQEALRDFFKKKSDGRRCVQCQLFKKKGSYLCKKCNTLLQNRLELEKVPSLVKKNL